MAYYLTVKQPKDFYKEQANRIVFSLAFGLFGCVTLMLVVMTFEFAANANVNQGVIGGLFAANIIYSSIFFYIFYKERITLPTMAAMLLIIAGVMCVSVKDDVENPDLQVDYTQLIISVLFSQITSSFFSLGAVCFKIGMEKYGFVPMKLVIDMTFVSGVLQIPGLLYCQFYVRPYYLVDILEGMLASTCAIGASVSIAKALSVGGKGGPTQCFENTKIIIPLVVWSVIRGNIPTVL